jgi:hypothetical protein
MRDREKRLNAINRKKSVLEFLNRRWKGAIIIIKRPATLVIKNFG